MQLAWKENWPEAQEQFKAWWNHDTVDKPFLLVWAPRPTSPDNNSPVGQPRDLQQQWLDVDYRLAAFRQRALRTYWGGAAFPYFEPYLGPGSMQLFLGAIPEFARDTVWYNPIYTDITQAAEPLFNPENPYWQLTLDMVRRAKAEFQGQALVGFGDLIENLDVLASLRGTEELLVDLLDHPADVHRLQKAILAAYFAYYDRLCDCIRDTDGGTCFMAFNIWGPGRVAKLQCDFSAMISPAMYAEFVLPYLREQCQRLDYTLYHLDGPDAICHLDHVLGIPELNAVQWVPGAGKPGCGERQWYPLYERILRAGKSLQVEIGAPEQIRALLQEFGPQGVMVQTWAASVDAANTLLEQAQHWV